VYEQFVTWRKSTRSSGGDNCIEVSFALDGSVGVRDSKNRTKGTLAFTFAEWRTFTGAVRDGEFDRQPGSRDSLD
jgi:hypothetical protein